LVSPGRRAGIVFSTPRGTIKTTQHNADKASIIPTMSGLTACTTAAVARIKRTK